MPKCSCAGSACNCNITVGDGLMVEGTGNAGSPYVISLASQSVPVLVPVAGPVDLSGMDSGAVAYLRLSGNVTSISLPQTVGSRIDLVIFHVVAGTTVAFPTPIYWAGGTDPVLATAANRADWITLRNVGDFWIGSALALNAF
jgi:hypothetical protein